MQNTNLAGPLYEAYIAIYLDLALCAGLGLIAIYSSEDDIVDFFIRENILASAIAIMAGLWILSTPFYAHYLITTNQN